MNTSLLIFILIDFCFRVDPRPSTNSIQALLIYFLVWILHQGMVCFPKYFCKATLKIHIGNIFPSYSILMPSFFSSSVDFHWGFYFVPVITLKRPLKQASRKSEEMSATEKRREWREEQCLSNTEWVASPCRVCGEEREK